MDPLMTQLKTYMVKIQHESSLQESKLCKHLRYESKRNGKHHTAPSSWNKRCAKKKKWFIIIHKEEPFLYWLFI